MFWDTSAIVPSFLRESASEQMEKLLGGDRQVAIWWATPLECQSAIHRRHRRAPLPDTALQEAFRRLKILAETAETVSPTDDVLRKAGRLLARHLLRAADALQLSAALVWYEEQQAGQPFVCLDHRLREAAGREGFELLPR